MSFSVQEKTSLSDCFAVFSDPLLLLTPLTFFQAYLVGANIAPGVGFLYWVLYVGDINADGQYSTAIVSDELCATLFVLSRTPTLPSATWKQISGFIAQRGFKGLDGLQKMVQDGCNYVH